jgi:lipopolysaccharide export system protein LptA
MWSGDTQLEADVIDVDRQTGRLLAHGVPESAAADAVHAVLPATAASSPSQMPRAAAPVRVASRDLVWQQGKGDKAGTAVFSGGVVVQEPGGRLTAKNAMATMRPAGSAAASGSLALGAATLESIVASGDVRLSQPGRTGRGETLTYTAADGRYELTGAAGRWPEVVDSVRGSTTGASLIFHAGDDSVEVAAGPGTRTRTVTRVKPGKGRPD